MYVCSKIPIFVGFTSKIGTAFLQKRDKETSVNRLGNFGIFIYTDGTVGDNSHILVVDKLSENFKMSYILKTVWKGQMSGRTDYMVHCDRHVSRGISEMLFHKGTFNNFFSPKRRFSVKQKFIFFYETGFRLTFSIKTGSNSFNRKLKTKEKQV